MRHITDDMSILITGIKSLHVLAMAASDRCFLTELFAAEISSDLKIKIIYIPLKHGKR